jgi:hypothetical protein
VSETVRFEGGAPEDRRRLLVVHREYLVAARAC